MLGKINGLSVLSRRFRLALTTTILGVTWVISPIALAGDRLPWTGGITEIEGAAGGGLVPWALIGGLGTADQIGISGFATFVTTGDFSLRSGGVGIGIDDRLEISFARQRFNADSVIDGLTLGEDIWGVKLRIVGDAVFAPDQLLPQIAVAVQAKYTLDFAGVPRIVGAANGHDVDLYVAATKVYFAALAGRNMLVNVTLRRSRADQFGLLGFGANIAPSYRYVPEASAGIWIAENIFGGGEYRLKPNNLGALKEDTAADLFLAWNPFKTLTLTAAWTDLGRIAGKPNQHGLYISIWIGV